MTSAGGSSLRDARNQHCAGRDISHEALQGIDAVPRTITISSLLTNSGDFGLLELQTHKRIEFTSLTLATLGRRQSKAGNFGRNSGRLEGNTQAAAALTTSTTPSYFIPEYADSFRNLMDAEGILRKVGSRSLELIRKNSEGQE